MPYVYAVTEPGTPAPPGLRVVEAAGLAAVVGDHDAPAPSVDALWQHERVVEGLMERGPVLPMRFGSTTHDVGVLLEERHAELTAALERVRGAVELGVRATPDPEPAASGTEYLMRRARTERAHAALAEFARASVARPHAGAYLVDRDTVDAFRARVRELDERLTCTGPWPPYSFVAA